MQQSFQRPADRDRLLCARLGGRDEIQGKVRVAGLVAEAHEQYGGVFRRLAE
jgi:hypothetical protein